jgi:HlyD family secretion protein
MTATTSTAVNRPRPPKRRSRRRWPWTLTALAILAGAGWWAAKHFAPSGGAATANPSDLVAVSRGRVEKAVTSSGKVVSNLDVDIKCRASGEVIKLPFDISQSVHKTDLLCQLDPTDSQLAVRSAEAMVEQSTAKLAQAKHDVQQAEENLETSRRKVNATLTAAKVKAANLRSKADRQKQLTDKQLSSREELETVETEAAAADMELAAALVAVDELKQQQTQIAYKGDAVKMVAAQIQADTINLDVQRQQLAYATVMAPIDGVVSALNVQKGTIVASGMSGFSGGTTIMTLSDLSHIFITATVDESDIGEVRMGQPARITVASFPGRTFAGQVTRIAAKGVNVSNVVTFEVKVEVLDEHKDLLRPEMTGNVTIIQSEKANVLTLPSAAVMRQGDQTVVTMADGQKRPVVVGLQGADTVEILSGLSEGEKVRSLTAELPTRWKSQDNGPPGP